MKVAARLVVELMAFIGWTFCIYESLHWVSANAAVPIAALVWSLWVVASICFGWEIAEVAR